MSTRGIICIQKDNEYKIAAYNHFDSYLEGFGAEIFEFIKDKKNLENLRINIDFVKKLTNEDINRRLYELAGSKQKYETLSYLKKMEYREQVENEFNPLCNDILKEIANGFNGYIVHDIKFAADSLFCEWGYVIDLDKNTFEIYKGFNESDLNKEDRFFSLSEFATEKYKPIKLIAKFSLENLPPSCDEFLKACYKKDNEYDEESNEENENEKYIIKLEDNIVKTIEKSENALEEVFKETYYYAINNIGSSVRVYLNDIIILSAKL